MALADRPEKVLPPQQRLWPGDETPRCLMLAAERRQAIRLLFSSDLLHTMTIDFVKRSPAGFRAA
jgi:hypothetical protein